MSGKPVHVFATRSNAETLLRTCPPDTPPTATSRPSVIATPKSLRACGSGGRVVQVFAAGSYASTFTWSESPVVPPTVYTSFPSDAAASICRGVGIGAPRLQELPSKTSVVFSSAPVESTPPVTTRRSPTTAAAAAALGCNRCGISTQRPLTTRQTWSVATFLPPTVLRPPSTTGFPCQLTAIAC